LRRRIAVSRLRARGDRPSRSLARAIDGLTDPGAAPLENVRTAEIERLRNELEGSSQKLEITDYGAGSPCELPSSEAMMEGRRRRRTLGEVCRTSSTLPVWGRFLFRLVRELKPSDCIELGTSLGISTAYQAAAMELNGRGRILTLEGSASLASLARRNFERLELAQRVEVRIGRFADTLEAALDSIGRVDLAFVDGHHQERATLAYFEKMAPHLNRPAVVVFDDISWSPGMQRAWQAIAADERVGLAVDLGRIGVVTTGHRGRRRFVAVPPPPELMPVDA
jgi:predicted O-methyltransferase YrrM